VPAVRDARGVGVDGTAAKALAGLPEGLWRALLAKGRTLYREKGPSYTIWWFLREVWLRLRRPVRFSEVHMFHREIAGARSKNATWKILKRLELYGLARSVHGRYMPVVLDPRIVEGSIDRSRVRTREQVLPTTRPRVEPGERVWPREVWPVIREALRLVGRGEKWRAVDLIAHTLLPVRKTGILLARRGDIFIYYESKTGKMHMIRSPMLARIFSYLGINDEVLAEHRRWEADALIRRMYGSHDIARRLHYLLKERGWFEYFEPGEWFYTLLVMPDGRWRLSILHLLSPNRLVEEWRVEGEGGLPLPPGERRGGILTREHAKEENEETYFNRSKGML
jgi:hypothetical protein